MENLASTNEILPANGLAILGTDFGCGKTVLLTGLCAMLGSYGFSARATKPIVKGTPQENEAELSFISLITRTPQDPPSLVLDPNSSISNQQWQKIVLQKDYFSKLTLIELPGSASTPLCLDDNRGTYKRGWRDSTDLASEFSAPCLLVSKHNSTALEKLSLYADYILNKGLTLLGLITVETTADGGREFEAQLSRDKVELTLLARTGIPYLGCIKYSPSISVPNRNQGNLVKLTTGGLEFLEVMKALNLKVPTTT